MSVLGPLSRWPGNPVLRPRGDGWQGANVYNPAAVVQDGRVVLLYRAHGDDLVSRLGLAVSDDGVHFEAEQLPVFEPVEAYESHGCEDPRLTLIDGTYYLTYTGFDGSTALLCLATSPDLRSWTRHGPLFPDLDTWQTLPWARARRGTRPHNKAGGILPIAVDGQFHMYVGEGAIYHATSTDLLRWTVSGDPVLEGRPGSWDADLVEVGAPPVVVGDRLVLLYNGALIHSIEDKRVDYRCGEATFSSADPGRLVSREVDALIAPGTAEERAGLVPNVTFVEGLVQFQGRWLAYYGQSDTTIGMAMSAAR